MGRRSLEEAEKDEQENQEREIDNLKKELKKLETSMAKLKEPINVEPIKVEPKEQEPIQEFEEPEQPKPIEKLTLVVKAEMEQYIIEKLNTIEENERIIYSLMVKGFELLGVRFDKK